jgi:hypothetical protein
MFIVVVEITIKRMATEKFPNRGGSFYFDFVCDWGASDNWRDLTNKGKITLPKKVYYAAPGAHPALANPFTPLSGQGNNPAFLRGEEVEIISGYRYNDGSVEKTEKARVFKGFISQVSSKSTFELNIEDNMWILKQTPAKGGANGVFSYKKYNVEDMLTELLRNAGLPFTVNALTKTNIGIDYRVNNQTIAQVLEDLRKHYYLFAYFRNSELRCGSKVYIDSEAVDHKFVFQQNIIDDDLHYRRKDDIAVSAIACSKNIVSKHGHTSDGHAKTKTEKLEVLVARQNGKTITKIKLPGSKVEFPANNEGERHEFFYNNITDPQILITEALNQLEKYYYDGFRGKFTTFGIPYVKHGDNVILEDSVIADRNGTYKVKSVEYSGGTNGLRQVIELDYKILT